MGNSQSSVNENSSTVIEKKSEKFIYKYFPEDNKVEIRFSSRCKLTFNVSDGDDEACLRVINSKFQSKEIDEIRSHGNIIMFKDDPEEEEYVMFLTDIENKDEVLNVCSLNTFAAEDVLTRTELELKIQESCNERDCVRFYKEYKNCVNAKDANIVIGEKSYKCTLKIIERESFNDVVTVADMSKFKEDPDLYDRYVTFARKAFEVLADNGISDDRYEVMLCHDKEEMYYNFFLKLHNPKESNNHVLTLGRAVELVNSARTSLEMNDYENVEEQDMRDTYNEISMY